MKRFLLWAVPLGIVVFALYYFFGNTSAQEKEIIAEVKKGDFAIAVTSSGELFAKNSVNVMGPSGINQAGVWQVRISNIIPEGKVINEGDFVAALDGSEIVGKLKDRQSDLDKSLSQFTQAQIDTTLELRKVRDDLVNLKYVQEEKTLILKQSKYEPPATIRQAEIDLEKAKRTYQQTSENYIIQKNKAVAKMQEATANLERAERSVDVIKKLLTNFEIKAPKTGMLIYHRSWNGEKVREGSQISTWEPIVATLPDMTKMVSRTYINEVDIQKVKVGQDVNIGLDAFPEKKLTGKVITVANVGEQKPNSDSKVFEVGIEVAEKDTTLMPAMTTSNIVKSETIKNVLFVPLEAIHSENKISFVYKKEGNFIIKQEVKLGKLNDNEVIIEKGLKEKDKVLISTPLAGDKLKLVKL